LQLSYAFPPISRTDIPCFPGGSELAFCGDVAAFGVLANCLSQRADDISFAFVWFQQVRSTFKKMHWVPLGKLACLRAPMHLF